MKKFESKLRTVEVILFFISVVISSYALILSNNTNEQIIELTRQSRRLEDEKNVAEKNYLLAQQCNKIDKMLYDGNEFMKSNDFKNFCKTLYSIKIEFETLAQIKSKTNDKTFRPTISGDGIESNLWFQFKVLCDEYTIDDKAKYEKLHTISRYNNKEAYIKHFNNISKNKIELCDWLDNDGDGMADEDFNPFQDCMTTDGEKGFFICSTDGFSSICATSKRLFSSGTGGLY